ncbi:MAG: hypothetical protein ACE5KQ_00280 [Thermoplasmata archaeon]
MGSIEEVFGDTLFLGTTRGLKRDEDRLWKIAEHLEEGERVRAFLSLKSSNLLLTSKRVLELKPHLDVGGMWNVLRFEGYEVTSEVGMGDIRDVDVEEGVRGGDRLRLVGEAGEQAWLVPASSSLEDSTGNARAFAARIQDRL